MSEKMRISAVSYTNAKPFVYGLTHGSLCDNIELSLDIPSDCADKLINNQIDIGLVPVAALLKLPTYHIVSNYCIGAVGAVHSVFIFSHKPITEIKTIHADQQSRTSNLLAKVLLKHHWKTNPEWIETDDADAFVLIGDRTFGKVEQYAYAYDLSASWYEMTAKPFVFAAWVSNKAISEEFISEFNETLKLGLANRPALIKELDTFPNFDMAKYLNEYIDYDLDDSKKAALAHFLELAKTV
jgi:chorismate dehydratase